MSAVYINTKAFLAQILEIIRVILKLYEQWKNFDDRKEMATVLNKVPKPKPPPNRYDRLQTSVITITQHYMYLYGNSLGSLFHHCKEKL